MRLLLWALALWWAGACGAATLTITPGAAGGKLVVEARLGDDTRRVVTAVAAKEWKKDLAAVYRALASEKYVPEKLDPELARLGATLFGELGASLEACSDVLFVVPAEHLKQPFDLLHWKGAPLYLAKPVAYAVSGLDAPDSVPASTEPASWKSAFLVSDPTADPEDAVGACRAHWPETRYFKAEDVTEKKLERARADVLLVSAHGSVKKGETDTIGVGDDDVEGETFAAVAPRLVYLDSCGLGVSRSFVAAFRAAGSAYYLAPIISNEAGDSSTATMQGFFARLHGGASPLQALFETRKALREKYAGAGRELLWKCFPFRLYLLQR